ncbi:serine hydrolase domain-containing protein [Polyangium jinanense]|uniref:Beta-lactamase family protein n=1 Tax=Polyangium jinanense TaxID=2829994 RepID=A0A9X3XB87_9BACT|nr:serine hydrolase domain-containing protein [Polyangium jinanense]MDC3957007.1 beta-lactamase family protein [Polyangium jinanense]MDC3987164.1 beta-lactamase family protein [Polyangium jinanense]
MAKQQARIPTRPSASETLTTDRGLTIMWNRSAIHVACACALLAMPACGGMNQKEATAPGDTAPTVPKTDPARTQTPAAPNLLVALDQGLRPNVIARDDAMPRWSLAERMRHYNVPGVAVAVLRNGEVVQAVGYGVRESGTQDKVDGDTLFSVGSISKVVTAATTLRLVAQGQLDLDRNVDDYLKRWKLPTSAEMPKPQVSLRMLMSHTSGLGVHGFADYQPGEPLPTLVQVLDGQKPAKGQAVRFEHTSGLLNDYSGGGVTVEEVALEDATGKSLRQLAEEQVFVPLGMRRSTFESPLSAERGNIAKAHDGNGARTALPRGFQSFAETGASGLWTSAYDLGRFVCGLIKSYQGRADFLPQPLATAMMTEVSPSVFGLGPRLGGTGVGRHFFHMGANDSYLAFMEGYPETGDGYVILTNGSKGGQLAVEIRNALADAIGLGAHPPLRTVSLRVPPSPDYAGRYRLDAAVPMDLRRALADSFEHDSIQVRIAGDAIELAVPGQDKPMPLLPLGPAQFVQAGLYMYVFDFRRDAWGKVRGVTVSIPEADSVAYYTRE